MSDDDFDMLQDLLWKLWTTERIKGSCTMEYEFNSQYGHARIEFNDVNKRREKRKAKEQRKALIRRLKEDMEKEGIVFSKGVWNWPGLKDEAKFYEYLNTAEKFNEWKARGELFEIPSNLQAMMVKNIAAELRWNRLDPK